MAATDYCSVEVHLSAGADGESYAVEISAKGWDPQPGSCPRALPEGLSAQQPAAAGKMLYGWLLASETLRIHWQALAKASPRRRIRIRLDSNLPELHALPWETLGWADSGGDWRPFAADAATPFSRYLTPGAVQPGALTEFPIRILLAAAGPDLSALDLDLPPLVAADELAVVDAALVAAQGSGLATVTHLAGPCTLTALEEELRDQGTHILYLVCHGQMDRLTGDSQLILADADNQAMTVSDKDFAAMVARLNDKLTLVYLASCESAARADADAYAGVAAELVRQGVPAVLAMQEKVELPTARRFAAILFTRLLQHGALDLACNEARATLMTGSYAGAQVPVLFSRLADGRLLKLPSGDRRPIIDRRPFEPETRLIPAGPILMGSTGEQAPAGERPQHEVTLPAYRIGRAPVTNAEYLAFVQATRRQVAPATGWKIARRGRTPVPETEDHPVVGVTWDDAVAYAAWLAQVTGRPYRLPTEAEWEKAARGTDARRYPWGEEPLAKHANLDSETTTKIGAYSPAGDSPYGCCDMIGNVREWTSTRWGTSAVFPGYGYPYDPHDGREDHAGCEDGAPTPNGRELRVRRGGCYRDSLQQAYCAARAGSRADTADSRNGFRIAMSLA